MWSFHETAVWKHLPWAERGRQKREAGYTNSAEFAVCSRRQGFIFFYISNDIFGFGFAVCFFFLFFFSPGIGSDQCHSAAFFSPSMTFSPLTGAPGLGLCRRMALACLLRREATGAGSSYSSISKGATRARRRPPRRRGSGHQVGTTSSVRKASGQEGCVAKQSRCSERVDRASSSALPPAGSRRAASQPSRHTSALLSIPGGSC